MRCKITASFLEKKLFLQKNVLVLDISHFPVERTVASRIGGFANTSLYKHLRWLNTAWKM
jgi:hypothetical protein